MEDYGICLRCRNEAQARRRRGLCSRCYQSLWKDPDALDAFPAAPRRSLPRDLRSRVLSQAMISPDGCWLWAGPIDAGGYGRLFTVGSAKERLPLLAHRAAYELYHGPISGGLHLDHLCRIRHCVNPAHLEPVTSQENTLRSPVTVASKFAARTHCGHGHEFNAENTRWIRRADNPDKVARKCRACEKQRRSNQKKGPQS